MPSSTHRVLKRKGRVSLIEASNRQLGIGYSVKIGPLGLWNGGDLVEAEKQFEQATKSQA